ncbi:MAG TPA: tetratricopeptide repeat protein [Gemmataceae bacterium]|nr:tetratricopeptide repeat protein [Gemmataceae bacterium]
MSGSVLSPRSSDAAAERVAELLETLVNRLQVGEPVDVEAFLADHPAQAEQLRPLLPAVQALAEVSRSGADGLGAPMDGGTSPGTLGDFRLVRELGRGGMGIVYEAEQISLHRRVALKLLPFAAAMDPRRLQRFQNEALAAAQLHHTNIVPVFAVGCERGLHYYAMQLIDGCTLADVIRRRSRPPADDACPDTVAAASTLDSAQGAAYFRQVAELGVQAAEALEHAHQMGVVHRDVKPANLMLDARGSLWVADFGLAQVQSDIRLTRTGAMVGTLRYASPEQALGGRCVVDQRADVYSLGATLYELLTGEPAFPGDDAKLLLRRIAEEEPRPPRHLNRAVPAELEIIVLKAMAKEPGQRYGTAQQMADDLRRWLEDKPIRARRASVLQRVRKLARRHRTVVTAAVVCLLVTLAALVGSVGWVLGDRAARQRDAEGKLQEALEAAEPGLRQGDPWDPALISAARRAEAQLNGNLVGQDFRRRAEQLQKDVRMLADLDRIRLEEASVQINHWDLIKAAPQYALAFREYGIDVQTLRPEESAALIQASAIRLHLAAGLDDWAQALVFDDKEEGKQKAAPLLAAAHQADPDPWRDRLRDALLSRWSEDLGQLTGSAPVEELSAPTLGLLGGALVRQAKVSDAGLELLRRAQERYPADFWINHNLAVALFGGQPPRLEEAIGFYRAAVALRPQSAGAQLNLGRALLGKGDAASASAAFREAIALKPDYAAAHSDLGAALMDQGKLNEAVDACRKAIALKPDSYGAYVNLGNALVRQGQVAGAEAAYRQAIQLDPDSAEAHTNLGHLLRNQQKLAAAAAQCSKAVELNPGLAEAHYNLGDVLYDQQQLEAAAGEYHKAIELNPGYVEAHTVLGDVLYAQQKREQAAAEYRKAIEVNPGYAPAHYNLGPVLYVQKNLEAAAGEYRKAVELKPGFAEYHCNLGHVLRDQGQFHKALEEMRRGHELGSRQKNWPYPSAKWVQQLQQLADLDDKLAAVLSGEAKPAGAAEQLSLGQLRQQPYKRLYAASARFCTAAFGDQPALAEDVLSGQRYNAACAAALAGCGRGEDAPADEVERGRFRSQALGWLRDDLAAWKPQLSSPVPAKHAQAFQVLAHWQEDADLAGVRGAAALAGLPDAERDAWRKLWADLEKDLQEEQAPVKPNEKPE